VTYIICLGNELGLYAGVINLGLAPRNKSGIRNTQNFEFWNPESAGLESRIDTGMESTKVGIRNPLVS